MVVEFLTGGNFIPFGGFWKKIDLIFIMHNLKQFVIHYQKVQPVI